jgi:hypothetical protein
MHDGEFDELVRIQVVTAPVEHPKDSFPQPQADLLRT